MKIAIIGSGISGLSAAWLLKEQHSITLIEKDSRLGGHANTVDVTLDGKTFPVDTGFLVHNDQTYPNLIRFFEALKIDVHPSEMTLGIQVIDKNIEWGGESLKTVFAQKKNILKPGFWRMIRDILKMNRNSHSYLEQLRNSDESLGEFLSKRGYSSEFIHWYLMPMGASIWSTPTQEMLKFPAFTFLQFCINHSLLQVNDRPQWKTIINGSRVYVQKVADTLSDIRLNTQINTITNKGQFVEIHFKDGNVEAFDKVIMATHPPTTLALLNGISDVETKILKNFKYQPNIAYLHTDTSLLAHDKKVWSAWNFTSATDKFDSEGVAVSYLINKLQPLPTQEQIIVTLNPVKVPASSKTIQTLEYEHPLFDIPAIEAQKELPKIQGVSNIYYAGAWTRYGFHEDGILSAVNVAQKLGVRIPWKT